VFLQLATLSSSVPLWPDPIPGRLDLDPEVISGRLASITPGNTHHLFVAFFCAFLSSPTKLLSLERMGLCLPMVFSP